MESLARQELAQVFRIRHLDCSQGNFLTTFFSFMKHVIGNSMTSKGRGNLSDYQARAKLLWTDFVTFLKGVVVM